MKYGIIKLSDNKEYKCVFTLSSFSEIEKKFGSIDAWEKTMNEGAGVEDIAWLIYIGLKRFHPEITEKYVSDNIAIYDLNRVAKELNASLSFSLPEEEKNKMNNKQNNNKNNSKKKYR